MTNLEKLKELLAELFMLDQADLDFGIYRVMNAKRVEVTHFLENDLLPQVRQTLAAVDTGDRAALETEKAKAIATAVGMGLTREQAEQIPKVKELQARIEAHANPAELENEIFSDLANFFRRYYQGGDFLALRRYKAGVYAIPYEGEEVKLHWANADQYYIKTSEYLRDYTFRLGDIGPGGSPRRVHFKLVEADTEADNKKAATGQERRFILAAEPVQEANGELIIRFEYRPDTDKRKQADLNSQAVQTVLPLLGTPAFAPFYGHLSGLRPTEKNPNRTLLEKHLADYTARNSFDYFIHKDIGGFLRRELDFFIKNEIMHLDDIEAEATSRVEQYLLGLRVAHMDTIRGFKVVQGENPAGEKVLVIWRNVTEKNNADLDAFFQKQGYNTKDLEFAVIYVNGDNNLENLKRADETWKVRRTEDEFKRLMFDVQDV